MVYSSADSDVAQRGRSFGSHQLRGPHDAQIAAQSDDGADLRHAQSAEGRSSFSPALWRTKDEDGIMARCRANPLWLYANAGSRLRTQEASPTRRMLHATSVLQAAASGLKWIEESDLLDGCNLVGEVQVEVVTRSIHTLALGRLREWLNSGGSPREVAMKSDLRERKSPPRAGSA
jgi:hypothetical protein